MKTRLSKILSVLMLTGLIFSIPALAQKGPGNCPNPQQGGCCKNMPGMTEDQQKKIDALQLKHMKTVTEYKNQIALKKAELRILESSDKPDKAAVDKKIDEIMTMKGQSAKSQAALHMEIRALLTDEQKVLFDAHRGKGPGPGGCQGNDDEDNCKGPKGPKGPAEQGMPPQGPPRK